MATGDLNGDGTDDLVVVSAYSNNVTVLLSKPTQPTTGGPFQTPTTYAVGAGPSCAAIADVDGKHGADIVVTNKTAGTISVLLNNGDGTFGAPITFPVLPAGAAGTPNPSSLAIGNVSGHTDGAVDVVVANSGTSNVSVLLGDGHGGFIASRTYAVDRAPVSIALARFTAVNDNGLTLSGTNAQLDIVTANQSGGDISVLLGNGNGTFQPARNAPAASIPYAVITRDFDGDGKIDVATCDYGGLSSGVKLLKGNGDGTFQSPTYFKSGVNPVAMIQGDFNGDGKPDLVTLNAYSKDVSLFINNGSGGFAPAVSVSSGLRTSAAAGDFNRDGLTDLVLASSPSGVTLLQNVTTNLSRMYIAPNTILTGSSTEATVLLTRLAPPGGVLVTLATSNDELAWVPANLTIPEGQISTTFHISSTAPKAGKATVTASYSGVDVTADLTVNALPPGPLKADITGDGAVDIQDIVAVARIVGGLDAAR